MRQLKLESKKENTMALELIKFARKILAKLESEEHKNWLVHKQTACGKDFSNPFMVDNLPKIVGLSTHLASVVKSLLVHDQTVHELVEFIQAHQPVSFELVLIYDSLWIVIGSVWGHFGDVRAEHLRLGDIQLLLVAFDSQLMVLHPLKNDNASGKHP
ncbi:hypothetical protein Tco_0365988 [Tanacetum coccineum]